ncbi:MAG: phosphomannomutase/phosphoglucomutase [bacterium]
MKFNERVFKAYDIRGKYPDEISEELAFKIGQAFARYTGAKNIMVGRDARLSSDELAAALIRGVNSQGIAVVDMGPCSTSCFYFAVPDSGIDAGIMITASHLGKDFNGFKPVFRDAVPLSKEQMIELKNIAAGPELDILSNEENVTENNFSVEYITHLRKFIQNDFKPMKIIFDCSNGMAGLYVEKVFASKNLEVKPLFCKPDGNFPNHDANPKIAKNRQKLRQEIISENADLGFMFDGDADRMYALSRKGEVIDPSFVSALIAEYKIKQSGKKKILVDVRTSQAVRDFAKNAGGEVEISACWTIPIKLRMRQDEEFIFGSETSGHYIFADSYWTDDGILAALNFLQAVSLKKESIDEILDSFAEKYFIVEETNFSVESREKAKKIINELKSHYEQEGASIMLIDGLSAVFDDWWFNLRTSETEPVIRLNLEANSQALMKEKYEEVSHLILQN